MPNPAVNARLASLPPFWAKLDDGSTPPSYHPLAYHLLDVAAVVEALWDHVLPDVVRRELSAPLGLEPSAARRWLTYLGALHDIGKLSPTFQIRPEAGPLSTACRIWGGSPPASVHAPHGLVSAIAVREVLSQPPFVVPAPTAQDLGAILGGHHGVFPTPADLMALDSRAIGQDPWRSARLVLAAQLAQLIGVPTLLPRVWPTEPLMMAAALVSVADWIGSDDRLFPLAARIDAPLGALELASTLGAARARARVALRTLGWFDWTADAETLPFERLFPKLIEPRPLQQLAATIASHFDPCAPELVIIEAPMGEGKTEAALYLAHAWASVTGRGGFYFALPTQATSNQIFERAVAFLQHQPHPDHLQVQLLHGHAALSAEFDLLKRGGAGTIEPRGVGIDADGIGHLAATAWFSHRKRGLLAPIGIGTVDQALLAVLQSKHVFVRLFGLLRRVVIVDEVHAYDTYMSAVLDRLLEWLAALRAPVVLLSATLPSSRRNRLCDAYAQGLGGGSVALTDGTRYPRLTRVGRRSERVEVMSQTFPVSTLSRRSLGLRWLDGTVAVENGAALGRLLEDRLTDGGCAAVVCNTVHRAQAVYQALRSRWAGASDDGEPRLDLLHARYPFEARQAREQRVVRRFGPPPRARPRQAVVVATQVIEQSLDVDFDLMVSDMAPLDLLLQRSGRLHRHLRPRPAGCAAPVLHVCAPTATAGGVPTFEAGTTAVYDLYVLLRSWLALRDRSSLALPDDVQSLIDLVYAVDPEWPGELPSAIREALKTSSAVLRAACASHWHEAESRLVKRPTAHARVWEFCRDPREDDDPEVHRTFQALTRLAPPSVVVVCLTGERDRPRVRPDGPVVVASDTPDKTLEYLLLARSVSVSRPGVVQALLREPVPAGWQRSALLRHCRPVVFDADGSAAVGPHRLHLDHELGLVVTRE